MRSPGKVIQIFDGELIAVSGTTYSKPIDLLELASEGIFSLHNFVSGNGKLKIEYELSNNGLNFCVPQSGGIIATNLEDNVGGTGSHGIAVGDYLLFEGVLGMTEINGEVHLVSAISANVSASVGDTSSGYTSYTSGGVVRRVDANGNWLTDKVPVGITGISEADPGVVSLVQAHDVVSFEPEPCRFMRFKVTELDGTATETAYLTSFLFLQ